MDAAAVGTRLTLTLPREGLLVLDGAAPVLRPSDLVTIDGDITLFSFAGLAARYGLSDAAPYAGFERRKALVARGRLVQVMVQNSVVILEGSVDSADAKAAAGRLAWATPGVFDVCTMLVADR